MGSYTIVAKDVKISPNPAKHDFTVICPLGTKQIQIINTLGQHILMKNVKGKSKSGKML